MILLTLISCDTTRLLPCCRLTPGYGGFERKRNLTLTQKSPKKVAVYKDEKYVILLDKSAAINKLLKYIVQDSLQTSKFKDNTDTLDLTNVNIDSYSRVISFIAKEIEHHNAVIIDRQTGQKLKVIIRRKFNYQTTPRMGRGGIEYIDPSNNYVIIRRDFWIS